MTKQMPRGEFIALIAMMFATIAFSIDAMLPALPEIGEALSPGDLNRAQLILTTFVLGMGIGTFFTGPLSDTLGRKPVIYGGAALYIVSAAVAWRAQSLELLLMARVVQGIGAAGPRVVAMAVVRDLYSGRDMARMISVAMMIFSLVPAIAPLLGAGIIALAGWREIFLAFVMFSALTVLWIWLRLPESLPTEKRRPFRLPLMIKAVGEMFAHPTVRLSILVQVMCMGVLFTLLTMVQPVFDEVYGRGAEFPYWFGAIALVSSTASLLNAAVVVRLGMRRIVTWTLGVQIVLTTLVLALNALALPQTVLFGIFIAWQTSLFFMAGTTMGNLNAIAMEPMGHIAGMAASVIGSVATVCAAAIAAPVGLLFDGSILPLGIGILCMCGLGFALMLYMGRIEER